MSSKGRRYNRYAEPKLNMKKVLGVIVAILSTVILCIILIYCIIPGLPFSGLLLNLKESTYVGMLFGEGSYF